MITIPRDLEKKRATWRAWYKRNKKSEKERKYAKRKRLRLEFQQYKSTLKCSNCEEDDPCTFDFHHLNKDEKEYEISRLLSQTTTWTKLRKELDKCIVLCSNCHRKIHNI